MKLKVLIISLLVVLSSNAQMEKGDVYVKAVGGQVSLRSFTPRTFGGAELDVMMNDKWGLHWSFHFGKKYIHTPLAPYAGVALGFIIGSTTDSTGSRNIGAGILFGALMAIIPEGISYNINLDKSTVSPYISPLQFDFIKNNSQKGGTDSYAGGAAGLKFSVFPAEKHRITFFGEYRIHYYKDIHPGYAVGLKYGFNLSN